MLHYTVYTLKSRRHLPILSRHPSLGSRLVTRTSASESRLPVTLPAPMLGPYGTSDPEAAQRSDLKLN